MNKISKFLKEHVFGTTPTQSPERKRLEEKAIEGAEKAVREYGRVFERLAEYDRR